MANGGSDTCTRTLYNIFMQYLYTCNIQHTINIHAYKRFIKTIFVCNAFKSCHVF